MNSLEKSLPFLFESALDKNLPVLRKTLFDLANSPDVQDIEDLSSIVSQLQKIVNAQVHVGTRRNAIVNDNEISSELYTITKQPHLKNSIVLDSETEESVRKFIQTYEHRDDLKKFGLDKLNTLFLYGPPGVGKTSLVTFISQLTKLPLMRVNLSNLISRYLGNTGKNISKIITVARSQPLILFFDEFDALAQSRANENDSGELRRVVNVLLTEIEDWNSEGILIAATNFPDIIDQAIIRRFSTRVGLKLPDVRERKNLWTLFSNEKNMNSISEPVIEFLAKNSVGASPSTIKDLVFASIRDSVLGSIKYQDALIINLLKSDLVSHASLKDEKNLIISLYVLLPGYSQRKLAELTGLSKSKIQRLISEYKESGDEDE
ncbi:AAA family ATPase [Weissella paramesenteroides]|uniref:AAA family ATPase n=1 Tax=Weissella paramesenteroides TaxID=1249 RepID=UPI0013DA6280|nr:AAA family ATPase [Weissella paramesenteroides]NEZ89065.1 AAA family ATPase [Weissella paramesenteroides]NFB03390.1 AAA family ATPase [Weissella paramesenteroides]